MPLKTLILLLAIVPGSIFATSSNILTSINWVGQRGNGNVIINFNTVIDEPNCNHTQVEISSTNPHAQGILSIVMMAYVSGNKVYVKTDSCLGAAPSINNSGYVHSEPKG